MTLVAILAAPNLPMQTETDLSWNGAEPLTHARELAPQAGDVLLVHLHFLFVRLESIQHPLVIALAAEAGILLLDEVFPCLIEQLLLLIELLLDDAATLPIALLLRLRIDTREIGR